MVDDMIDHLSSLGEQPAWRPVPESVVRHFQSPVPRTGVGEEETYRQFREHILPYSSGAPHPRFFGWVQGNGTPIGMMAEMLAAGMNAHLAGFNHAPVHVEQQVVRWLAEIFGFPHGTGGTLQSGATMANLQGIAVARYAKGGVAIRSAGLQSRADEPLVMYASSVTHRWIATAADILGLGTDALRAIPVDDNDRIDPAELRRAIGADRAAGRRPFCVVGNAGTVGTGATDDLVALADIAAEEDLWFHVDGAFGVWGRLARDVAVQFDGLERADSLATDLHKWCYLPFAIGCLLVRDDAMLRGTFANDASYIEPMPRGVIAGGLPLAERTIELTREFRALKAWMTLTAYGLDAVAAKVQDNVAQARRLGELAEQAKHLELLAPVHLNITCFRFHDASLADSELNAINREILMRIQERGIAVPSSITLDGRFALRAAFTNHRTTMADVEALAEAVVAVGREVVSGM